MNVLVDTCIWTLALRKTPLTKKAGKSFPEAAMLESLIEQGRAVLIGAIRQEVLSGIKEIGQYQKLKDVLRNFKDVLVVSYDYEEAVRLSNLCRSKGIQGSNTDFLICAVAKRSRLSLFTSDNDLRLFQQHIKFKMFDEAI